MQKWIFILKYFTKDFTINIWLFNGTKRFNIFNFQVTGNTPLMLACKDNKTPLIDRLVELGADVTARNNVSWF